ELAVEVVDLVLKTASEELGPGCFVLDAVLVGGADGHATGAVDIAIDVGYRETALFRFFIRTGRRENLRIDQHEPGAIDIDDCQPLGAPDLRGGEPDSLRRVHRLEHVGDEVSQLVGDFGDALCRLAKNRVAQHPDVEDAHPALTLEAETSLLIFAIRPRSMMTRVSPD